MFGKLKNIFKFKTKQVHKEDELPLSVKRFVESIKCDEDVKKRVLELIESLDDKSLNELTHLIEKRTTDMKEVRRYFKKKIIPKVLLGEYNEDNMFYVYLIFKYAEKCDKVKENRVRNEYEGLVMKIGPKNASKILKKHGYNIKI